MRISFYDSLGNPIEHLTQWDLNRKLKIKGVNYVSTMECRIFGNLSTFAYVLPFSVESDYIVAEVPNKLLQYSSYLIVGIYDKNFNHGGEGKMLVSFRVPVESFKKPDKYEYVENIQEIDLAQLTAEARSIIKELNESGQIIRDNTKKVEAAKTDAISAKNRAEQAADEARRIANDLNNSGGGSSVKVVDVIERGNYSAVTSNAVALTVGNIGALLETI